MKLFYIILILAGIYILLEFRHLNKVIDTLENKPANWLVVALEEDTKTLRVLCTECGYTKTVNSNMQPNGKIIISAPEVCPYCHKRMSDELLKIRFDIEENEKWI